MPVGNTFAQVYTGNALYKYGFRHKTCYLFKDFYPHLWVKDQSKALNYVFTIKKKEALDKGIEFFSVINIEDQITMDDTDLCLLVSNLLDNAIRHVGIRNKIFTEIICGRGQLMIRIANSIDKTVLDDDHQLIIEKAEGHGYGISTVRTLRIDIKVIFILMKMKALW